MFRWDGHQRPSCVQRTARARSADESGRVCRAANPRADFGARNADDQFGDGWGRGDDHSETRYYYRHERNSGFAALALLLQSPMAERGRAAGIAWTADGGMSGIFSAPTC